MFIGRCEYFKTLIFTFSFALFSSVLSPAADCSRTDTFVLISKYSGIFASVSHNLSYFVRALRTGGDWRSDKELFTRCDSFCNNFVRILKDFAYRQSALHVLLYVKHRNYVQMITDSQHNRFMFLDTFCVVPCCMLINIRDSRLFGRLRHTWIPGTLGSLAHLDPWTFWHT